jgi:hypothetical protein
MVRTVSRLESVVHVRRARLFGLRDREFIDVVVRVVCNDSL